MVNGQGSDSDRRRWPSLRPRTSSRSASSEGRQPPSSSSGPTFDFSKPPLAVAWEDRARSLAGLPGLSVFGAHLSSRWLVALAAVTASAWLERSFYSSAIWVLYKLGFEGKEERVGAAQGGISWGRTRTRGRCPRGRWRLIWRPRVREGRNENAPAAGAGATAAATPTTTTVGGGAGALDGGRKERLRGRASRDEEARGRRGRRRSLPRRPTPPRARARNERERERMREKRLFSIFCQS